MQKNHDGICAILIFIGGIVCMRAGLELFGRRYIFSGGTCGLGFWLMWMAAVLDYNAARSLKYLPWNAYFLGGFGCTAAAVLIYFFS